MAASGTVYNPAKIGTVGEDKINAWRDEPHLEMDLLKIPGIGAKTKEALAEAGVKTSHQLIGVYLSFFREGSSVKSRVSDFYSWLKSIDGVSAGHVNAIVRSVVEKVERMLPGTYNAEEAV